MPQQYPPDNGDQSWNNPQQPPYQQPPYSQFPQQPPYYPQQPLYQHPGLQPPPPPQKKKPNLKTLWRSGKGGKCGVLFAAFVLLLVVFACAGVMNAATSTGQQTTAPTQAAQTAPKPTVKPKPTQKPKPTPTPKPTPKPTPTQSPAQLETTYKASTTDTTVTTMDKDGAADQGNEEHFTCTLIAFVKDSSGNTAGANVTDPGSVSSSFVQIIFTPGTDITQLNTQDTIEVWGTNQGVSSGTNAFGATVQEVVVQANYLSDQTTGYKADS